MKIDIGKVNPPLKSLQKKYARAYDQFFYEYSNRKSDEINCIKEGSLRLYAVDESTYIEDWTEVFNEIRLAIPDFKYICSKPKSHLRSVNEIRPIETVKRVGYESIPYLASHSEDWLARTASGLKPARLYSRVEDDDFQIYENHVVKTLIDTILRFLRKTRRTLHNQVGQLTGILSSTYQTNSFGFDAGFSKAVKEMLSSDSTSDDNRQKSLELAERLQKEADTLIKQYISLRKTRLYRYMKKAKPVTNPLKETNILLMDRHYKVIFKLWRDIHHAVAPKVMEDEANIADEEKSRNYQQFCATLCGFTAHVLGFELYDEGHYRRTSDNIDLSISCTDDMTVKGILSEVEPREVTVPQEIDVPIESGMEMFRFSLNGNILSWPNDITDEEIESFCSTFKKLKGDGREKSENKRRYIKLKEYIDNIQRHYEAPRHSSILIVPVSVELDKENSVSFEHYVDEYGRMERKKDGDQEVVIALPCCNENEQMITGYSKRGDGISVSIVPLTMFDINSFRRVEKILYRQILRLGKQRCSNCGGSLRAYDSQYICDSCGGLAVTKTRCPNKECGQEYLYMRYTDVNEQKLEKMRKIQKDDFYQWDSRFQYKDIVEMKITSNGISPICPYCGK